MGGSRDSGTDCALVGVSRHNFTVVYSVLWLLMSNKQVPSFLPSFLNKIAIHGTPQMAVDKEAISLSRVYSTILSVTSCVLAHKADTEERHRGLSAASFATWPQLHPRAFISRSTDLLRVSFGRPLLLFPAGVQRMAILGIDVGGILFTWPIHLHLLFFTSNEMGSIPVRSWSSALVILFGQKM